MFRAPAAYPFLVRFVLALALVVSARGASAAGSDATAAPEKATNDFLFPGSGKVSLTGSTGLPFAALGELSVGVGDRFAAGGIVAGGPFLGGFATGINPRLDLVHVGPIRLVVEAPLLWYPDIENTNNWIVFRPDVRVEGKAGRFRVHGSVGAMAATMVGASPVRGPIAPYGGSGLPSGVQDGSWWNTAGAGVACALSPRTSVFTEGFLIMHGVDLAGPEWFALPLGAFFGVTTTL